MASNLFSTIELNGLILDNRIIIPPMCQYSAHNGNCTDWHKVHYGGLSQSGAGMMIIEATAISPEGRISRHDIGLWSDENEYLFTAMITSIRKYSSMPIAVQLAHAGRKASSNIPWEGVGTATVDEWTAVAPSAIPYSKDYKTPASLNAEGIQKVVADFAKAASRAAATGVDAIELHAAHGYLLHSFLSPVTNKRTDEYGGSFENRIRLTVEVYKAMAKKFASPIGIRLSASDWIEGGWDIDETVKLVHLLKDLGCAYAHISGGGLAPEQIVSVSPGYQVNNAYIVKKECEIPVIAVGLITNPEQAETIITSGQADMVAIGREMMFNPRWGWYAAAKLGASVKVAPQYIRGQPNKFKNLFKLK